MLTKSDRVNKENGFIATASSGYFLTSEAVILCVGSHFGAICTPLRVVTQPFLIQGRDFLRDIFLHSGNENDSRKRARGA
ncbi:hypothetical protein MJ717_001571 [Cronobacter sakazakii]|uniref:hypothetical protein n=1 Tax=Cronobacter sakazakii TaxID=28141 RepID=UPI0011B0D968|nr:hypothetical protein [Cronobacter sakazakii]EIX1504852.1 hypothetical protein [Cronobacter sakazakii]EIX1622741.1 hypothetical protein [Cronobacter sakazakii]EIX1663350.1 hypothetical protein [Cronobacter sakazakii]EIX1671704.1 hypothetical protein [Cronobacter sakazakii]EIX1719752.1 hypothetical protein [Cronobacter sakazakii]